MMRRVFSVALMVALFGLVQSANAGITVDLVFVDTTTPTGITVLPGDTAAPGCAFGGFAGGSTPTGRCMNVMMYTTYDMVGGSTSVSYDSDNGLGIIALYEWKGLPVSWSRGAPAAKCGPQGGLTNTGSTIESFDCGIPPPVGTLHMPAGTYKMGTIVWDTSATTTGTETIAAVINDLFDGMGPIINGNAVLWDSSKVTVGTHILTIVPEPGTASLLGLGLVGLILAGRRSRA